MQMLVCPGCERPNGLAARFCLYCGFRFKADPAHPGAPAPAEHKLAERMVCDGCSAPLTENRREQSFRCDYCGAHYQNRNGGTPLIIYQPQPEPGAFESTSDAAVIAGSILEGMLGSDRGSGWGRWGRLGVRLGRGGGDNGCLLALLLLPLHAILRAFFR